MNKFLIIIFFVLPFISGCSVLSLIPNATDPSQIIKSFKIQKPHIKTKKAVEYRDDTIFISSREIKIEVIRVDSCIIHVKMPEDIPEEMAEEGLIFIAQLEKQKCFSEEQTEEEHYDYNKEASL